MRVSHRSPSALASGEHVINWGRGSGRRVTDTEGEILFSHLETGTHAFRIDEGGSNPFGMVTIESVIEITGAASAVPEGWDQVEVVEAETATLTLVAAPRGSLIGRLREAGLDLAGATISLHPERADGQADMMGALVLPGMGGGEESARTDGDGFYEILDLKVGDYVLAVEHPTRHMVEEFEVSIREGENRFDPQLSLSILEGRITSVDGEPLEGLRVTAAKAQEGGQRRVARMMNFLMTDGDDAVVTMGDGEAMSDEVYTDADGRYRLRGVTPDVDLVVRASGEDVQSGESDKVRVAPDQVKGGVNFTLKAAGRILVEVFRADGTPAQFVMVRATYQGEDAEGVAPVHEFVQSGSVELTGLKAGLWNVALDNMGFNDDQQMPEPQVIEVVALEKATATFHVD